MADTWKCMRGQRGIWHGGGMWRYVRRKAMTRLQWFCRSDNYEAIEVTRGLTRISVSNNHEKAREIPLEKLDRMISVPKNTLT